jgi:hypothetical protein
MHFTNAFFLLPFLAASILGAPAAQLGKPNVNSFLTQDTNETDERATATTTSTAVTPSATAAFDTDSIAKGIAATLKDFGYNGTTPYNYTISAVTPASNASK